MRIGFGGSWPGKKLRVLGADDWLGFLLNMDGCIVGVLLGEVFF